MAVAVGHIHAIHDIAHVIVLRMCVCVALIHMLKPTKIRHLLGVYGMKVMYLYQNSTRLYVRT